MNQNFTDSVVQALETAFHRAETNRQTEMTQDHLLWAFLKEPQGYFSLILQLILLKALSLPRLLKGCKIALLKRKALPKSGKTPTPVATIF